jgi:hypothetical protein
MSLRDARCAIDCMMLEGWSMSLRDVRCRRAEDVRGVGQACARPTRRAQRGDPLRRLTLVRAPSPSQATEELRILTLRFGAGRPKTALERRTNPKLSCRACSHRYEPQSFRGESAGVAKRPRERSLARVPNVYDSQRFASRYHPSAWVTAKCEIDSSAAVHIIIPSPDDWGQWEQVADDLEESHQRVPGAAPV